MICLDPYSNEFLKALNFVQERETYKFQTVRKVMRDLVDWRRQLLTGTLTQDQTRELKLKVTAKIDWGNR